MHKKMKVEETNLEAMRAKKAAIKLGYYRDNFIDFIVPDVKKRDFIMHRGYWSRSEVFRGAIRAFVEKGGRQILSLGCGLDTLPFWTLEHWPEEKDLKFFECDLLCVVKHKIEVVQKSEAFVGKLKELSGDLKVETAKIESLRYALFEGDLNKTAFLTEAFTKAGIDPSKPTLIISECVFVYLHPETIPQLRTILRDFFNDSVLVDYEMIGNDSPFTKVMLRNFAESGIPLLAIKEFPSIEAISQAFKDLNFKRVEVLSMEQVYYDKLNPEELKRISKLEWADEFEEFNLMQSHYFVSITQKGESEEGKAVTFEALKNQKED